MHSILLKLNFFFSVTGIKSYSLSSFIHHPFKKLVIIRELNDNGNMIEISNSRELKKLYENCMKNARQVDMTIDYKILKIGMLGSYENTSDSSSDSDHIFPVLSQEI